MAIIITVYYEKNLNIVIMVVISYMCMVLTGKKHQQASSIWEVVFAQFTMKFQLSMVFVLLVAAMVVNAAPSRRQVSIGVPYRETVGLECNLAW